MHIKKLIIEADNGQATITLNYNEIKCICSSLFRLSKIEKVRKESDFDEVMDGFISLFNILKHGMIPESELQTMCNLICEQVPEIEKGGAVIANLYAFPNTTNYIQEMDEKITTIYKISGYTLDDILERLLKGYDFVLPRKSSVAENLAKLNPPHSCTNCKNIVGRFDCSCPYCKKKLEKE